MGQCSLLSLRTSYATHTHTHVRRARRAHTYLRMGTCLPAASSSASSSFSFSLGSLAACSEPIGDGADVCIQVRARVWKGGGQGCDKTWAMRCALGRNYKAAPCSHPHQ